MLQVGITGGIGSGKTTVCKMFATLGIPIYYADQRAKELMAYDPILKSQIISHFGNESYHINGYLNKVFLSSVVFSSPKHLKKLNELVHPIIHQDANKWHQAQKNVPYTIREAALIYESGGEKFLDQVIVVYAPKYLRIQRLRNRSGWTIRQIKERMDAQWPEKKKKDLADFIIKNNQKHLLIPQVLSIHQTLVSMSQTNNSL